MNNEKINELITLLENNKYTLLKEELIKYNEADIAEFLEEIDEIEALAIFRLLPEQEAIETFSFLDSEVQESFIASMTKAETVELVDKMYIDDMVDVIEEMPDTIVRKIMRNADGEKRGLINQYLSYPKQSAGSIMTATYISIKEEKTVGQIIKRLRKIKDMDETFYTLYTTDDNMVLKGYIEVRDLLINDPDTKVSDIINENIIYATTTDDQEYAAKLLDKYEFLTLPVVDHEKKLVGVITFDDALKVLSEEAEEDFQKMAGMSPNEKKYMDISVFDLAKQRMAWLIILLFSASLSQLVIDSFNDIITVVTGLIAFMPMLSDSAGNAGSQASTTIIRGLSLGEIEVKDTPKVLFKEFLIALMAGGGLAIVNFFRVILFTPGEMTMAFVVSISLLITIVLSKMFGALLPIIATKIKVDPTIMAAPLLTTIVDSMSLFIYFTIAKLIIL